MSGHNKWSKIKHTKGAADQKKGRIYQKLVREIMIAARNGTDPNGNSKLRLAINNAKAASMPKDNIERAIKRGSGEDGGAQYEDVLYEGYGPGGVAVMVYCLTDNKNRSVADVRHAFTRCGGNLGSTNSVSFMFDKKGVLNIPVEGNNEDDLLTIGLEVGVEDLQQEDDVFVITCEPNGLDAVREAYDKAGKTIQKSEVSYIPQNTTLVEGDAAEKLMKMIDQLEELDDVQEVYSNYEMSDAEMDRLASQS